MEKINVTMDFNEEFRLNSCIDRKTRLYFMRKYKILEAVFAIYIAIKIGDLFNQLQL